MKKYKTILSAILTLALALTFIPIIPIYGPVYAASSAAPDITSVDSFTCPTTGGTFIFASTSSDPSDTVTWTATGTPTLSFSGTTMTVSTGNVAGIYPLVVSATNSQGTTTQNFTLTITPNPEAPQILIAATPTSLVATATSLIVKEGYAATSSTDTYVITGSPTPEVKITAGDPAITWNAGTNKFDIAAGLAVGAYLVKLTATNTQGFADHYFTFKVDSVGTPPTIKFDRPSHELDVGYKATSTDLVVTMTGNPMPTVATATDIKGVGIKWDPTTQKLLFPTGLGVDTYPVEFTASNGIAPDATATFNLIVNGPSYPSVDPPGPPSSGGGGTATGTTYKIAMNIEGNGTAFTDLTSAIAGAKITITVKPKSGNALKSIAIVNDKDESIVPVAKESDTKYSFYMPAANVTVTVVFAPADEVEDEEEGKGDIEEPVETARPSAGYTDVDPNEWYIDYIDFVIANGLMIGTSATTFEPNTRLSRAMMVQILYNMEGKPETGDEAIFSDVAADSWYFAAVTWSYENEIVFGYDDGRFGPDDQITREQMVTIFYRYAEAKGYDVSISASIDAFEDAGDVSDWAVPAMEWAVGTGLIIGRDAAHIAPKDTATRAEVATIVTRFVKTIVVEVAPAEEAEADENADEAAGADENADEAGEATDEATE